MSGVAAWPSRVAAVEGLSPGLKRFALERADGEPYPAASAGAHVLLTLQGPGRRWRNAYSLVSAPGRLHRLEIVVRRATESRGGSAHMHASLAPGDPVDVAGPVCLFPLHRRARRHLLISAGIGLTPFLSYLPELRRDGLDFALHQVARPEDADAFDRLLAPYAEPGVTLHRGRAGLDLGAVLSSEGLGTHLYVCGPEGFMRQVTAAAFAAGWPAAKQHLETFGAPAGGAPFAAILARSRRTVAVGPEQTLLDALEAAGIDAPSLCRGGACGQCRLAVLGGRPDHRDHVLDAAERARGDAIMSCVSRALDPTLVLDL